MTDRPPPTVLRGLACDDCIDAGRTGEPYVPLAVRMAGPPRHQEQRPIVAVSIARQLCAIESGETFDLRGLVERIRERRPGEHGGTRYGLPEQLPPAVIVTDHALDLLGYLDQSSAARSPFWQWQVSVREGGAWRPEARSRRVFLTARPVRFGYASRHGKRRRKHGQSRWYLLIDPTHFCELPHGWGDLDVPDLLRFGIELRDWTNRAQLPLAQSVSSYGARLLRDERFGKGWRRKVPAATNRQIRRRLPGNHYQLTGTADRTYQAAHKFDMQAAHHHAAAVSRFPHPDRLEASGWYRRPAPPNGAQIQGGGAIHAGTDRWRELLTHPGLFVIATWPPPLVAIDALSPPPFRNLRDLRLSWQTVTSSEIEHGRQLGVRFGDIWCCWTSPEPDDRLAQFAGWSRQQLDAASLTERKWLKPLLLAAYGMLAARPNRFRNGWRWCHAPTGAIGWPTRHGQLVGLERASKRTREAQTVNVLWRAIIESCVRLEALRFARELRRSRCRPIAVYADAVFAVGGYPAWDALPAPWRYEGEVHDLTFDTPARYRSREETRLPGTPRRGGKLTRAM